MPKKLDRAVKKIMSQGHSRSSAYAIASKSTGIKRKRGGGWTQGKNKRREL